MRKKHKNEIFNYLNSIDLGLNRFEIFEGDSGLRTEILFKNSPLKFIIRTSIDSYENFSYEYTTFSPNYSIMKMPFGKYRTDFSEVLENFKNWIINHIFEYLDELEIPDLWGEYFLGEKTLKLDEINFGNRDLFSCDEKEQIRTSLNKLKFLISEKFKTNEISQQLVEERIDYLIGATSRLNKFDWKSVVISTIMSISVTLTLDTDSGKALFDLFRKVFNSIPMLVK